jgi:hypothetical protein
VILLPRIPEDEATLDFILRHELTHYRRRDNVLKFVVTFAVALHWFNPAVYLLKRRINTYCEYACDEAATRGMDLSERQAYCGVLIEEALMKGERNKLCFGASMGNAKTILKRRLLKIMDTKRRSKKMAFISVVLAVLLICTNGLIAGAAYNILTGAAKNAETEECEIAAKIRKSLERREEVKKTGRLVSEWTIQTQTVTVFNDTDNPVTVELTIQYGKRYDMPNAGQQSYVWVIQTVEAVTDSENVVIDNKHSVQNDFRPVSRDTVFITVQCTVSGEVCVLTLTVGENGWNDGIIMKYN